MRRLGLACCSLGFLSLTSCSSARSPEPSDGPVGAAESAIAYGTADSASPHTAVVALLAPVSGGFTECSGTVVQVKNGSGYVLTAAHCCNMGAPTVVVMSNDYTVGEQYLGGGAPQPPVYAVTPNSVWYDSKYNQQQYDFCMLKFAAPAATPVIPVATPADGLALGATVEHVGFGVTDATTNNSGRRTAQSKIDQGLDATTMTSSQGGASHTPGVCEGDSGGPVLFPAGVGQAGQKVVGTVSYGNSATCSQNTINVCMRVTSESAPGGFIANFLADTPSGTQVGSAAATCQTCANGSQQGTCKTQAQSCANDPACITLNNCLQACTTQACANQCESTAGTTAVNELTGFDDCVCQTACPTECATECAGSTSSSSSSSGGAPTCQLPLGSQACWSCLDTSCCFVAQTCANDPNCTPCLNPNPPASCSTSPNLKALETCISAHCSSQCPSTTSTSSSGGNTSSSGGNTSSGTGASGAGGSGAGAGGTGASGTGAGQGSGGSGNNNTSSGCSVSPEGSSPAAPASLAGILLGAALAFSRRRKSGR